MNGDQNHPLEADNLSFDRLVDGELGEVERRELLVRLESEPGGWRRCALKFLESQCWKEAIGGETRSVSEVPETLTRIVTRSVSEAPETLAESASEAPRIASPAARWAGRFGTLAAMAASFFVALSLGSLVHRTATVAPGGAIGTGMSSQLANTGGPVEAGASPWRWVTVSGQGNATQRGVQLPAVGRGSIDERWLSQMPPPIPDDVLQALGRTGHRVQQRRQFVPMPLDDGRQVIVPVDQIEVHYVGNGAY